VTIYGALDGAVETIFGDSVASIEETGQCVRVGFDHAPPRAADLVIGADGLHSRVRQLVFGPDAGGEVSLGYHVAAFEVLGYRPRDELVYVGYGVPGRQIFRFSMRKDKTLFLLVFCDTYLPTERPANDQERRLALTYVFADVGWECPQILAAMANAGGLYFDRVSQIRLDRWTKGRTALVGDAAACVSLLAGQGSLVAMAEAYVLNGRVAHLRRCLRRGLCTLRTAADAVAEAQAEDDGEIRLILCPEDGLRHCVPQPGRAADAAVAVRDGLLHRPRNT